MRPSIAVRGRAATEKTMTYIPCTMGGKGGYSRKNAEDQGKTACTGPLAKQGRGPCLLSGANRLCPAVSAAAGKTRSTVRKLYSWPQAASPMRRKDAQCPHTISFHW